MLKIHQILINIKNGQISKKAFIEVSLNNINISLLNVLWEEGFIQGYEKKKNNLKVFLKYNDSNFLINYIKFISKPSLKIFISSKMLWKLNEKLGVFVLSTDKGLLTLKKCKKFNLGGVLLFFLK
jgi:small subunit ribosomal protein S8